MVSAFAPYKRIDLAIEACKRLSRRLVVIGTGQDAARLQALAGPETVFLGWQSDEAIRDHLRRCRALLFPGEEDFGIVPVEAKACGTPVIALGNGRRDGNHPAAGLIVESDRCLVRRSKGRVFDRLRWRSSSETRAPFIPRRFADRRCVSIGIAMKVSCSAIWIG